MDAIETTKFQNGKAVEHWSFGETQDMTKMMQAQMQNMGKMNKKEPAAKK
jgi:hypothetical protein